MLHDDHGLITHQRGSGAACFSGQLRPPPILNVEVNPERSDPLRISYAWPCKVRCVCSSACKCCGGRRSVKSLVAVHALPASPLRYSQHPRTRCSLRHATGERLQLHLPHSRQCRGRDARGPTRHPLAARLHALTGVLEIRKAHVTHGIEGLMGTLNGGLFQQGQRACADLIGEPLANPGRLRFQRSTEKQTTLLP